MPSRRDQIQSYQFAGQRTVSAMVGIPNAPDTLPAASGLMRGAWSLCTAATPTSSGEVGATTTLFAGRPDPGGRPVNDDAVMVSLPRDDTLYLVWHGHRYQINKPTVVLEALAMRQEPKIAVGASFLNALPQGQAIGPLAHNDAGVRV